MKAKIARQGPPFSLSPNSGDEIVDESGILGHENTQLIGNQDIIDNDVQTPTRHLQRPKGQSRSRAVNSKNAAPEEKRMVKTQKIPVCRLISVMYCRLQTSKQLWGS